MLLTLFLLIGLSSKAQYRLAVKGDRVGYDSAVVVELNRYRLESKLLNTRKSAIDSLRLEVELLYQQLAFRDTIRSVTILEVSKLNERISAKDAVIEKQQADINFFYQEATKPRGWKDILRKEGVAASVVFVVVKLISK